MIDVPLDNILHLMREPVDHDHWATRLRDDPRFAAEMKVCREWRIPHSTFLGGEEGTPPGVWSQLDREKAIAYVIHEAARCSHCGLRGGDWPLDEDGVPIDNAFVVVGERCFGCQATQQFLADHKDNAKLRNGEDDPKAMWGLVTRLSRAD